MGLGSSPEMTVSVLRIRGQSSCDSDALALPSRELSGQAIQGIRSDAGHREELVEPSLHPIPGTYS